MSSILIKNGTLVDDSSSKKADLLIEDGKIAKIGENLKSDGAKVIDVHSHHLRSGCKQLFGLTGHAADQEVSRQPFEFCDLVREGREKGGERVRKRR